MIWWFVWSHDQVMQRDKAKLIMCILLLPMIGVREIYNPLHHIPYKFNHVFIYTSHLLLCQPVFLDATNITSEWQETAGYSGPSSTLNFSLNYLQLVDIDNVSATAIPLHPVGYVTLWSCTYLHSIKSMYNYHRDLTIKLTPGFQGLISE